MRDISDLVKDKPAQPSSQVNQAHSDRMNAIITEYDKRLLNEWHPRAPRRVWPKGISK